jgi:DNA replication protein DnaC
MENSKEATYLKSCGIATKWLSEKVSLNTYAGQDKECLAEVEKYLNNYTTYKEQGRGLYLYGTPGSGKTYLAMCVAKHIALHTKDKLAVIDYKDMLNAFMDGWQNYEVRVAMYANLRRVSVLVIDRFTEPTGNGGKVAEDAFGSLLNYRVQANKITIVSSTVKPSEIKTKFTAELSSLMKEAMKSVRVNNPDFRDSL